MTNLTEIRTPSVSLKIPARAGFSLIEVVLALGLLGTVLISVASLFVVGGKQVKSGKNTTAATALAHEIMEVIEQVPYDQIYGHFGGASGSPSLTVSTTAGGNAGQWQAEIARKLGPDAFGTIAIIPLGCAGAPSLGTSQALQVRVTLTWDELGSVKSVSLQGIRF
jgi:type II secretory pathway pseudopilin PulG